MSCLYHIPQVCGVGVPAAVLGRLRARYGAMLSGVKDSSGDFDSFLAFRAAAPDVASLVGEEVLIVRALAAGGKGTICGMANLVPGTAAPPAARPTAQTAIEQACRTDRRHPDIEGGAGGHDRRADLAQHASAACAPPMWRRRAHRRDAGAGAAHE